MVEPMAVHWTRWPSWHLSTLLCPTATSSGLRGFTRTYTLHKQGRLSHVLHHSTPPSDDNTMHLLGLKGLRESCGAFAQAGRVAFQQNLKLPALQPPPPSLKMMPRRRYRMGLLVAPPAPVRPCKQWSASACQCNTPGELAAWQPPLVPVQNTLEEAEELHSLQSASKH